MSRLSDFVRAQAGAAPPETGVAVTRFGSPVKALSKSLLQPGQAVDSENVTVEDGSLELRDGFRNVIAAVAGQTTQKGLKWLRTIVNSTTFEAFVSVDNVGGVVTPNEIAYDGTNDRWARTPITAPGPVSLDLSDTYWRFASFRTQVFGWNYNSAEAADDPGPLVTYTLGDPDSWVAVKRPVAPAVRPTVTYYLNSGGGFAYTQYFGPQSGYVSGDVTVDATVATTPTMRGTSVEVLLEATGQFTVTLNLKHSAAAVDFSDSDSFTLRLTLGNAGNLSLDWGSFTATMNGSGSQELSTRQIAHAVDDNGEQVVSVLYLKFEGKTRSSWTTATTLTLKGNVTDYTADTTLTISPLTAGGISDWGQTGDSYTDAGLWQVMYTWVNPTTGYESDQSDVLTLDTKKLLGQEVSSGVFMGSIPTIGTTATAESGVTKVRVYARQLRQGKDGLRKYTAWRLVAEQDDTDTTLVWEVTPEFFETLGDYSSGSLANDNILCAAQYKGWMVWGYRDGSIRHSRYGEPTKLATDDDAFNVNLDDDDVLRGATFQLNDDTPRGFVQVGDTLVVLGAKRVYVQNDTTGLPAGMTPPSIVQGAPGCIGFESFDAWKLDSGVPGCAYVSTDGASVWFIAVVQSTASERGPKALEVTVKVRGWLHEKLYGGSTLTDPESVQLLVDQETDAVVLFYSQRALILRRPGLDSESRDWDVCDFEPGHHGSTWGKLAYAPGYGIFGVRFNGAVDQFFRANVLDTTTAGRTTVECDLSAYAPTLTDTGTGFVPASTDTVGETVTFAATKDWVNGLPANVDANGGGLFAATGYFLRRVNSTTFSLHLTAEAALTGTAAVNLTAAITATVTPRDHVMFGDFTTAGTNPGWSTGIPVVYDRTEGGLVKGQTVYLRRISKSAYSVHLAQADADSGANPVSLTASLTGRFRPVGRDDGTAVEGYWESGEFIGPNRRVQSVEVHRSALGDSPTVQARTGDRVYVSEVDSTERLVVFDRDPGFAALSAAVVTGAFGQFDPTVQYFLHRRTDVGFSVHLSERAALRDESRVACTVAGGYFVPGSAPVALESGERFARFGPSIKGNGIAYRVTLPEGCGAVRALRSREVVVGQMEHK